MAQDTKTPVIYTTEDWTTVTWGDVQIVVDDYTTHGDSSELVKAIYTAAKGWEDANANADKHLSDLRHGYDYLADLLTDPHRIGLPAPTDSVAHLERCLGARAAYGHMLDELVRLYIA